MKVIHRAICFRRICVLTLLSGGTNNRDDPWVYRPGIYVRNMQRDGMCVLPNVLVLVTSTDDFDGSNDKATFYTDTMESSYMRGRRSIVP